MNLNNNRFSPLILSLCVVGGLFIGSFYTRHFSGNRLNVIGSSNDRLRTIFDIIADQYVDTVDIDSMVEKAIPTILSELDPHSMYLTAKDAEATKAELQGSFSGIGVEFVIRDDTLHIQNVIQGGPADKVGIVAGDMIVAVDGKSFTGKQLTNEKAFRMLRGNKGTKVQLVVKRFGSPKTYTFNVIRDDIETTTIAAAYMMDDNKTGYIRVKTFGEKTYYEFLSALARLSQQRCEQLIIDLRDNGGGVMTDAVRMANEFLPANRMIVYTQGRRSPREDYVSDGRGSYSNIPLVVLIDAGSASASEIFAGAMQDNDRAVIIGRRSFGKGLVQKQIDFSDGSLLRLTTARYYTPSGRCIQKPYSSGDTKQYAEELIERFQSGEYFTQDSIKHTGPAYHTRNGRVVYGGGGITPDIFVPEDTINMTSYFKEAVMSGLINRFTYDYTDRNRSTLKQYSTMRTLLRYLQGQNLLERFAAYGEQNGLQRRNLMLQRSAKLFQLQIYSRIIYNMLNEQALWQYSNQDDPIVREALKVLNAKASFPKPPAKKKVVRRKVAKATPHSNQKQYGQHRNHRQ
ncbi:MAG: S41 family peptidase [Bacteroidaceae bacterium]|nr:S41 family peptidase [Bacteroidaceae bacterium]